MWSSRRSGKTTYSILPLITWWRVSIGERWRDRLHVLRVIYEDGRHELLIRSTLVKDTLDLRGGYVLLFAQDMNLHPQD